MQKINYPELFKAFTGREEDLRKVTRYHVYKPMFYRSNLFTHSKRILWLFQEILPLAEQVFGDRFNSTKAQLMAVVHDDLEVVMGDIMAGHKKKMSTEQLAEIERLEQNAIAKMSIRFPNNVLGYSYKYLTQEVHEEKTLEARLLKYFDRYDSFGEALHEIFAGNKIFVTNSIHPDLGVIELPTDFNLHYLPNFCKNNPEFNGLFSYDNALLVAPTRLEIQKIAAQSSPHTKESIYKRTGYEPYDAWRETILKNNDPEEIENLYIQKER